MKIIYNLLLVLLIFPFYSQSQSITRNEIDEATNTLVITTEPWNGTSPGEFQESNKIFPYFKYLKTEKGRGLYFLSFIIKTDKDLGCLREKSGNVIINFTDGKSIALKQNSDTNCDFGHYDVSYYLVNKPQAKDINWLEKMNKHYDMLSNKPIESIAVEGSDDVALFKFKENEQNVLMKHTDLLNNEM